MARYKVGGSEVVSGTSNGYARRILYRLAREYRKVTLTLTYCGEKDVWVAEVSGDDPKERWTAPRKITFSNKSIGKAMRGLSEGVFKK